MRVVSRSDQSHESSLWGDLENTITRMKRDVEVDGVGRGDVGKEELGSRARLESACGKGGGLGVEMVLRATALGVLMGE